MGARLAGAMGQGYLQQVLDRLLARLEPGERLLAKGRAYAAHPRWDERDLTFVSGPGALIVVTDHRVLWAERNDQRWDREVPFSAVTASTEIMQGHRYALLLEHEPIERLQWIPAHRVFGWRWGNAEARLPVKRSVLAFSHRDTEAAVAIRAELQERGVPARPQRALPPPPQVTVANFRPAGPWRRFRSRRRLRQVTSRAVLAADRPRRGRGRGRGRPPGPTPPDQT